MGGSADCIWDPLDVNETFLLRDGISLCFQYTYLPTTQFKEVFASEIDFMIERLMNNYGLQLICNMFLVQQQTSSIFGSILVDYLLQHLPEMGCMF